MNDALHIRNLSKRFAANKKALSGINLRVASGEMVALIGASGSGKSTLLRMIAGLAPADGDVESIVEVHGQRVQQGGRIDRDIRKTRAQIGFIFQQFNLVGRLSVILNVMVGRLHMMPSWRSLTGIFRRQDRQLALEALARVGIAECHAQRASTLSGGQQQRAAIARALVQGARLILADEPIASLDPESSRKVMESLARINQEDRCTVLVSLHQVDMAIKYCPRVIALNAGHVVYDGPSASLTPSLLRELYGMQAEEILNNASSPAVSSRAQPLGAIDACPLAPAY
jgi:phosphonate transport system ATP-binding protein